MELPTMSHPMQTPATSQSDATRQTEALNQIEPAGASCCGFSKWGLGTLAAIALIAAGVGLFYAGRSSGNNQPIALPEIDATSAVTSEQFSMATGAVSDQVEGLFVLDHNSGLLQCSVIYPRIGQFAATFSTNVGEALASGGKGGKYMMVTGMADFPRSSQTPIGSGVVYVLDSSTGNYACYAIPFNQAMVNSNRPQSGQLRLIARGSANPLPDRGSLR